MKETLPVAAIKNGTAIDHITSGQALNIIQLLALTNSKYKVTIGMNLPSKLMGKKDLIKIEQRVLTEAEANEIVVFAPSATINVIENYTVIRKISTHLPHEMRDVFLCPNHACITHTESVATRFFIREFKKEILLGCYYCEKEFNRDQVSINIQRHGHKT